LPSDAINVFGAGSPDAIAAATSPSRNADYLGIAIHCAQGSPLCAGGQTDALGDEPGGYGGLKARSGDKYVEPDHSASGPIQDLDGNVVTDASGHPGFPNIFSPTATQSLGYLATMLEAGVQVVYGYIADAHDNRHGSNPGTFGPGEAGYVAQLKEYNT